MFLSFDKMPDYSRLWIYQVDRELTDSEVIAISSILKDFLEHWESHGNSLIGSFQIRLNRFVILAVNEQLTKASGCSIDKSVEIMKTIEEEFDIALFDRTKIAYMHENNIKTTSLVNIKEKISLGEIKAETIIFDNLILIKEQLESQWQNAAGKTWLKRYFQNVLL